MQVAALVAKWGETKLSGSAVDIRLFIVTVDHWLIADLLCVSCLLSAVPGRTQQPADTKRNAALGGDWSDSKTPLPLHTRSLIKDYALTISACLLGAFSCFSE